MTTHITLTSSRTTKPDPAALLSAIKAATGDPTAVLITHDGATARGKKATAWTEAQVASAQDIFDTAAPTTPRLAAQRAVDTFPIELQALVLALVDQINVLRAALPSPKPAITPAQALAAIRAKASTL